MRFSFIALLFLVALSHSSTAQNFQPFRNKYKYQFSYTGTIMNQVQSGLIHGMQVDSAKLIGSDSVFYFNRLDTYSSTDFQDNFWGYSMVKKPGGEYFFLIGNNIENDTLVIETQESLGAQWTFKLSSVLYTIQYKSYKQETVLTNQTDFVKTYLVQNASGFIDSIKISENFGLIYSFPFSDNYIYKHTNFNLTYIFNSKTGENKFNYFEYFNYDLGDVLEYTRDQRILIGYPDRSGDDIYKVISKTTSSQGDTVIYTFSKCHLDANNSGTYSATQTHCEMVVTAYSVTGNFPYLDPLVFPANTGYFAYAPDLYNSNRMLYGPAYAFEGYPTYSFQIGLGLQKYFYNGLPNYDNVLYQNIRHIKQSNTDDDCSGLQIALSTRSLHASSANLVIAPNPFEQSIALNATDLSQGNWTIRIVSYLGVEVYTSNIVISSSNQQIDLSNLPSLTDGLYFLSLENESQVYSQKIVKK